VIYQTVHIDKEITLLGGWTDDFQDQGVTTILDAEGQGRVIYVSPNISATISTFDITGGDASTAGMDGHGGGIYADANSSPTQLLIFLIRRASFATACSPNSAASLLYQ